MKAAFRALLMQATAVAALAGTRINWGAHPQGLPLPGIVLTMVSDFEPLTLEGRSGLQQGRVQVDCYAIGYLAAHDLSVAVRAVLHGYKGGQFRLIEHAATRDDREGGNDEAERPFRIGMDFITHWRTT
jgi:hypothetical protein